MIWEFWKLKIWNEEIQLNSVLRTIFSEIFKLHLGNLRSTVLQGTKKNESQFHFYYFKYVASFLFNTFHTSILC